MRSFAVKHLGKILVALIIMIFGLAYYLDELAPDVLACKEKGGRKLYGECWVRAQR